MSTPIAKAPDRAPAPIASLAPDGGRSKPPAIGSSPAIAGPGPRATLNEIIARESRQRRRRRIVRWSVAAAVPALAVAAWLIFRPRPLPFAQRFRIQPVSVSNVVREVTATGTVQAVTTVQIGAEISGRIADVLVDYNDRVRAGQILARFDRTLLSQQVQQARGAMTAARAALDQARTNHDKAAVDSSRALALWAKNGSSDADRDAALSAARLTAQAVAVAQAQLAAAEAADSVARTNLNHTVIVAPINGVIITRNIDPGQTVASALQTPVLFTEAADLRRMQVVAAVDEADVGEVTTGQRATFTVNAYPDRTFRGVVTQVRNSPVVVQDVVTYGTVIEVANADLALKPGMTASVRINIAEASGATNVPNAALTFTPPSAALGPGQSVPPGPGVWAVSGNALRRFRVHPGITDGERTVIARDDLPSGIGVVVGLTPEGRTAFAATR